MLAVKHFGPYLYGRELNLRNDHASLIWLYKRRNPAYQIARWLEILAEIQFSTQHRVETKHANADGLSRACAEKHNVRA